MTDVEIPNGAESENSFFLTICTIFRGINADEIGRMKKQYPKVKDMRFATTMICVLLAATVWMVLACDDVDLKDGDLSGTATLPLLPFDLPIFPTDVTLDGLASGITNMINEYNPFPVGDVSEDDVQDVLDTLGVDLAEMSAEILQPGVLSVAVDDQIADTFQTFVSVTNVGVNFTFANDTDVWVPSPVEFQLFMGDGDKAEAWDEDVMIPFADPRVDEDGKFIVEPGEEIELSIDNVPHLVEALNNSNKFGIGYKAIYRPGDEANGADIDIFIEKFGFCIASQAFGVDLGECPDISDLIKWHLTLKKFELVISAETDFNIPEIPGCEEFADEYDLPTLKDACPDSSEE